MKKPSHLARIAGVLYLQFAVFSAGVMYIFFSGAQLKATINELTKIPSATELFSIIAVLFLASLALGIWLTLSNKVYKTTLILSVLVAAAAIFWNVLAFVFWLSPIVFLTLAYRSQNAA
ncbi:MAG: hypothetical protein U1C59_09670 [Methylotenera sp.]|nr:hypothetical protein [Methylotenera sp.]